MYRILLYGLSFILLTASGCEINSGTFNRRINVMDYLQTKYDIYYDLENVNDTQGNCGILINTPNDDVTVNYAANDRSSDAEAFQRQTQIEAGRVEQEDPVENQAATSASTSYSSGLFGDGDAPIAENNTTASTASAFNNDATPTGDLAPAETFGTQENPLYRLTVTSIQSSEFTDIRISHPTTRTATLETPGWAQVVMKPTARSGSTVRYDSVEVNVKYFINQTPQGRWTCTERVVNILDTSILSGNLRSQQVEPRSLKPEVGW